MLNQRSTPGVVVPRRPEGVDDLVANLAAADVQAGADRRHEIPWA